MVTAVRQHDAAVQMESLQNVYSSGNVVFKVNFNMLLCSYKQCCCCSRNTTKVTPKIIYLYYQKNYVGSKNPKIR